MAMSLERKSTFLTSAAAFLLAAAKLIAGILTGSMAVISSAIDSLLDMTMSLFNYYAVKQSELNPNETFNYGRGKIEGIAALIEGALIACSSAFIIYQSVRNLIDGKQIEALGAAILTMTVSMIATACIVAGLTLAGRQTKSLIIRADLLHYKSDLWTNFGVIVSLGIIALSGLHFIDGAVSIAIALFIAFGAYKIIKEGVLTLLDRAIEEPLLSQIREIVANAPRACGYHYLRTRKSAKTYVVEAHLVFDETISLKDAHDTSDYVETAIAALDKNAKWLITVHLDPRDDSKDEN
ncbi:MAG: cation diffusion facilitator family transporter [Helicobacteraceae bacterium]|jgi:cation diffusion facilitator family transporter|nr:cation diffusion facilitator family transporter [Helicobacteraceae bacterium]